MNLIECLHTLCRCYKANERGQYSPSPVTGIVVHSTGANNPNLRRYVQPTPGTAGYDNLIDILGKNVNGNAWNNPTGETCVHAFVGKLKDENVATAQVLPFDFACWGCANGKKGSFNYSPTRHIQFEICEDNLKDSKYFNSAVKGEAVEFCAYLCKKFDLDVLKIVSHKEAHDLGYASNHGDIDHWLSKFGFTMTDFRSWVSQKIKKNSSKEGEENLIEFKVKSGAAATATAIEQVELRSRASLKSGNVIATLPKGTAYIEIQKNVKLDEQDFVCALVKIGDQFFIGYIKS